MNSTPLEKELILQPELWRLAILLRDSRLDVALYPPVPREEMIWRSFELDSSVEPLRAVEDVIYANPLLFSDFKQVDCLIDNVPAILLPAAMTFDEASMAYDLSSIPAVSASDADLEIYPTGDPDTIVALRQIPQVKAFLQRTFYNIRFRSRLADLAAYLLSSPDAAPRNAINVLARDGRLTLIATTDGPRLLLANTFSYENETDALYYILAVRRMLNLDPATTPVLTSPVPQTFTDLLQAHISPVAPIPFPMLRYRTTPSTLQAPFDLIIRPICE